MSSPIGCPQCGSVMQVSTKRSLRVCSNLDCGHTEAIEAGDHPGKTAHEPGEPRISVFLSYARGDDEPFVSRLYDDLVSRGFDAWFDRVCMPSRGLTFLHEIRDEIDKRDRFVLVAGPKALVSDHVTHEWRHAHKFGKPINPVLRMGEIEDVPPELRLLDARDFRDDSRYQHELEALARQLSEPVPPMGKLVGIPSLPAHFLERRDRLGALKDAVMADITRTVAITGAAGRVGVHGMGGIGKSVLASVMACDSEVRRAFPDGIFWMRFGQQAEPEALQRWLISQLGDTTRYEASVLHAALSALLADKRVLLILDDVWEAEHANTFDVLGRHCRALLTTRNLSLITALGGVEQQVQLLTKAECMALLADWSGRKVEELPEAAAGVADECGRLPLALSICGALVRDGMPWAALLEALSKQDLEYLDHPHGNIIKSIKLSYNNLSNEEQRRFIELAVFPADVRVPEAAAVTLWGRTGGLERYKAYKVMHRLQSRALVQFDTLAPEPGQEKLRCFSLHDLLYDFASNIAGDRTRLHESMADAYWELCSSGWTSGPDDGWFFQRLAWHMLQAGRTEASYALAGDRAFLDAQARAASEDPDLPLRTLRYAIHAACTAEDPVRMAEFTLLHARGRERQQVETPLDALLNPAMPRELALKRAWQLVDSLDMEQRIYSLLLLTWKLQQLGRPTDARKCMTRVKPQQMVKLGDRFGALAPMILAWIQPIEGFDLDGFALRIFGDEELGKYARSKASAGFFTAALDAARNIGGELSRAQALSEIAQAQAQAGEFAAALDTTKSIGAKGSRAKAFSAIAQARAHAGQITAALEIAKGIGQVGYRAKALSEIAQALAQTGQFTAALETAKSIGDFKYRAELLSAIAQAQAQVRQDPTETFTAAQETAKSIGDEWSRAKALSALAEVQALAGQDPTGSFMAALETTKSVEDEWSCADALSAIAQAQARAGEFAAALETAKSVGNEGSRADALSTIAQAQARIGEFTAALKTAKSIGDERSRAKALSAIVQAQAQAGEFAAALEIAKSVGNEGSRADALSTIAQAQARIGEFTAALKTAKSIGDEWSRAGALSAIAQAQVQAGQLTAALETAKSIGHVGYHARALSAIAQVQALAGKDPTESFSAALETAKSIGHEGSRARVLSEIAQAQAKAGQDPTESFGAALKSVESIGNEEPRAVMLSAIARSQAQTGQDPSESFTAAIETAESIGDEWSRAQVLSAIARSQALAGQDPTESFSAALETARRIAHVGYRAQVLLEIAQAQAQTGQDPTASFGAALETAKSYGDELSRAKALSEIATVQGLVGQNPTEFFTAAIETAESIEDESSRARALLEIAQAQAQTGQDPSESFTAAIETAESIGDEGFRVLTFLDIAQAQAEAGQDPTEFFTAALKTVESIGNKEPRAVVLSAIALSQAQAGQDPTNSCAAALETAKGIEDELSRAEVLSVIAQAQALSGQNPTRSCTAALDSARALAKDIEDDLFRPGVLSAIARAQAYAGQFTAALETAKSIEDELYRAELLSAIALSQAKAGQSTEALETAKGIEDELSRAELLSAIALSQAQAGQFIEALKASENIDDVKRRAEVITAIGTMLTRSGNFLRALRLNDLLPLDRAGYLGALAAALMGTPHIKVEHHDLQEFLTRAADYLESALAACALLASLYPAQAGDIAKFLMYGPGKGMNEDSLHPGAAGKGLT